MVLSYFSSLDEHVVAGQCSGTEGQARRRGKQIGLIVRIHPGVLAQTNAPAVLVARLRHVRHRRFDRACVASSLRNFTLVRSTQVVA